jgi:6-phospho-beta-glucosidase
MTEFPKDFLWGASTSAYQVEGAAFTNGKKASQQDILCEESHDKYGFATSEVASAHYYKFREDISLMKEMGFTTYRFSLSWSRIFPDGIGEVNPEGIEFYHQLIDELLSNEIEPIVTIYHYDLPWALVEKYNGWLNRQIVADFEYYARYVINEFKDKVKYWTTINEQSIIVQYWTKKNYIPESLRSDDQLRYQANHYMNLAHAIACKLVHEIVPGGLVGSAIGYSPIYPLSSNPKDIMAAQNANDLHNSYYLDIYFKGIYTKSAMTYLEKNGLAPIIEEGDMALIKEGESDFLALNYYLSECAKDCSDEGERRFMGVNLTGVKGEIDGYERQPGFYQMCRNPNLETNDWDWAIDPVGLEYILRDIYTRYNKPLMITENGLGAYDKLTSEGKVHDNYRIDYLRNHIKAMKRAIDYGVEVIAYCPWSAIDLLSTTNGVKKRYGFVYVDRTDEDPKDCERIRKDSFYWYKGVISSNGAVL